jgi:hypothetical protein
MFAKGVLEAIMKRGEAFNARHRPLSLVPRSSVQLLPQNISQPLYQQVSSCKSYPSSSSAKALEYQFLEHHSLDDRQVSYQPTHEGVAIHKVSSREPSLSISVKKNQRLT